jgi:membrane complex biogenesis BtpA family protein
VSLTALFGATRPLVGVVHLPASLGCPAFAGPEAALASLRRDLATLSHGGVDAVLLENEHDKPHTLTVSRPQLAWLAQLARVARDATPLPLGIGVQRIDWEAALSIAAAVGLAFVRLDVFVDRVRMQGEVVSVDPAAVLALRRNLGAEGVALWTDVHVKHAELVAEREPPRLAASARAAAAAGSDAVLVTGRVTGETPLVADLAQARAASAPVPVLVGSGLRPALARELAEHADGALVGTALQADDGSVDPIRVRSMVDAWRAASRR